MQAIVRICILLSAMLLPMSATALTPVIPKPENLIIRALWADERLWLVSTDGQVFSLSEHDRLPTLEYAVDERNEKAVGICMQDGHVEILTQPWSRTIDLTLRHRQDDVWHIDARFPNDGWYSMACDAHSIYLADDRDLLTFEGGKLSRLPLPGALHPNPRIYLVGADLYVGSNPYRRGGMVRIDRQTGKAVNIEAPIDDICAGLPEGQCNAVNGVVASPWESNCSLVALGMAAYGQAHLKSRGRLLKVCDDRVSLLYAGDGTNSQAGTDTIAFWHVLAGKDKVYATTSDGLHIIHSDGEIETLPMPRFQLFGPMVAYGDPVVPTFRTFDDFAVNFDNPDFILVLPSPNQRREGGDTPLLVPRH